MLTLENYSPRHRSKRQAIYLTQVLFLVRLQLGNLPSPSLLSQLPSQWSLLLLLRTPHSLRCPHLFNTECRGSPRLSQRTHIRLVLLTAPSCRRTSAIGFPADKSAKRWNLTIWGPNLAKDRFSSPISSPFSFCAPHLCRINDCRYPICIVIVRGICQVLESL